MANQPKKYKKFVATAATATLVASAIVPVASAKSFSDVAENNEFQPFIDALSDAGIINGYADGTFKPGAKLTRGQVVKMLGRWVESNGTAIPTDWNSKQRFNDVPVNAADQELVKYAALVKDAGVFSGSNGNLLAGNNITRQQMAKVLNGAYTAVNGVSLVELAEEIDDKLIQDLASSQQEFEGYIQALVDLEISTVSVFRPSENVTRAQFAKFLYNTINLEESIYADVKAINNTTVEVTFDNEIDDIKALKFAIEGLEVKDAVVKQTNKKTAVITTSSQEAGKEYTVTESGKKLGKFTGVSAVIPKSVNFETYTEASKQGVIGKEVTLNAQVTVEEGQSKAGIPVTFNIVNSKSENEKKEVEVKTDEKGVATYTYTRYYNGEDQVVAYATSKSSVSANAKVYWASAIQLAVEEITVGNELANDTKKSYKVIGDENTTYYIAIKENLNVAPDKITDIKVQDAQTNTFVTPYELTTGATKFATVKTNAKGEGSFTIYGSGVEATPVVYSPETTPATNNSKTYNKLDLQAVAKTVKFVKIDRLQVNVSAIGTADSAEYYAVPVAYNTNSAGGRSYSVTVTDKEGKLAPEGTTAYVAFPKGSISANATDSVYFSTGTRNFEKVSVDSVFAVTVGKEGKAEFRVAGKGSTAFVKPTVFLNTTGDVTPPKLDTGDVQQVAEVTYFKTPVVNNAVLTVKDSLGRTITTQTAGEDAHFTYQSVDQNGFAYRPTTVIPGQTITVWEPVYINGAIAYYQQVSKQITDTTYNHIYTLAFDVTSTFGNVVVKDANGVVLPAYQNLGNTKTYYVNSNEQGTATVRVTTQSADTVSVNVTGASNILPTTSASVNFTDSKIVPDVYSGAVQSYNSIEGTLTFAGKNPVRLYGQDIVYTKGGTEVIATYQAFIDLLAAAPGTVSVTRTVKDGVTTFNIYNIATTGTKPTDTAVVPNPGSTALVAAKEAAAKLDASKYTAESYKAVTDAVAAAEKATTDAEKATAAKAITDAIAALKDVTPEPSKGEFTFTSKTATANASLPVLADYNIAGTIAESVGTVATVKIVLTAASGESTDALDVTYNATDRTFEYKTSSAKATKATLKAYDASGKELASTEITF